MQSSVSERMTVRLCVSENERNSSSEKVFPERTHTRLQPRKQGEREMTNKRNFYFMPERAGGGGKGAGPSWKQCQSRHKHKTRSGAGGEKIKELAPKIFKALSLVHS